MPFEHSNKRILTEVGILAAVLAVLGWGSWVSLRAAAAWGVRKVPTSVDAKLGDLLAKAFDAKDEKCQAQPVQEAVKALTQHLAQASGTAQSPPAVRVVTDSEPNAFALPGGHIFVMSGLLQRVESVDELAGVLAHELGHVARRHHLARWVQELGLTAAVTVLLGDLDALTGLILGRGSDLLSLTFSRDHEEDADSYALELLRKSGYRPQALGEFLDRLEQQPALPSFLRTHPTGKDRRTRLEDSLRKLSDAPLPVRPLPTISLSELKLPCDGN